MKNTIIFTGVVKKVPIAGDSVKNKFFIDRFKDVYDKVYIVGINKESWHLLLLPFDIIKLIITACLHPKAKIVISSNSWEANKIICSLKIFGMLRRSYYWVVGGAFHQMVGEKFKAYPYKKLKAIYVQSPKMVQIMEQKGFTNVFFVPNSKQIDYYPAITENNTEGVVRFVFLSRVHPDKGCGQIIDCAKKLNENGFENRYSIDLYGKLNDDYKDEFVESIKSLDNVNYKGFLDLTKNSGYDELSRYDVMLFPTWWYGEGFPGIVIDAYIAGLPIIASDWNFNSDVVSSETGTIIPAKDSKSLLKEMLNYIEGVYNIAAMKTRCQQVARNYDNRFVLSVENLKKIGML